MTELAKDAVGAVTTRPAAPSALDVTLSTLKGITQQYDVIMDIQRQTSIEEGAQQQMNLMRGIKMVLRLEGTDFNKGWSEVLAWANLHLKDTFSMAYRNRFLDYAKRMTRQDQTAAPVLIHLIAVTADPAARQLAIKRYDFNRLYTLFDGTNIAEKLQGFYM